MNYFIDESSKSFRTESWGTCFPLSVKCFTNLLSLSRWLAKATLADSTVLMFTFSNGMAVDKNWYLKVCFLKSPKINNFIYEIHSTSFPSTKSFIFPYCFSISLSNIKTINTFFLIHVNAFEFLHSVSVHEFPKHLEIDRSWLFLLRCVPETISIDWENR